MEECNTVNDLRCERVEDEQCETVDDEECDEGTEEECDEEETVCDTVETEECYTKYEDECETVYKERCSTEYELECTTGEPSSQHFLYSTWILLPEHFSLLFIMRQQRCSLLCKFFLHFNTILVSVACSTTICSLSLLISSMNRPEAAEILLTCIFNDKKAWKMLSSDLFDFF